MDSLYLTESIQTEFLQTLYGHWDKGYTPYSRDFDTFHSAFFKYYNELALGEFIEIAYLTCKSEQHRLTPIYDILRSLVILLKCYYGSWEEDDRQLK